MRKQLKPCTILKILKALIIPHYIDYDQIIKMNVFMDKDIKIINILAQDDDIYRIIDEISSCDYIFSSSLHGVILGELYSIKRKSYHVKISDKVYGNDYKFKDFFSSINREYINIDINSMVNVISKSNITSQPWYEYDKKFDFVNFISSCPFITEENKSKSIDYFENNYSIKEKK